MASEYFDSASSMSADTALAAGAAWPERLAASRTAPPVVTDVLDERAPGGRPIRRALGELAGAVGPAPSREQRPAARSAALSTRRERSAAAGSGPP